MNRKLAASFKVAGDRLARYREVVGWTLGLGFRYAPLQMVVSPICSLLSVVFQMVALLWVIRVLSGIRQSGGASGFGSALHLPGGLSLAAIGPEITVVAIVGLLVAAAGLQYVARVAGMTAERRVTHGLGEDIFNAVTTNNGFYARWRMFRKTSPADLLRAISGGARYCGMALRMVLSNILNFTHLIVGFAVLVYFSPYLFTSILIVVLVTTLLNYPLSMRAIGLTRELEEISPQRMQTLQRRMHASLADPDAPSDEDGRGSSAAAAANQVAEDRILENKYLNIVLDRLRILEVSRLIYSFIFAATVGVLLWLLVEGFADHLLDFSYLLVMFLAFRFAFNGARGVLLLITSMNRFMPQILRTHEASTMVERVKNESGAGDEWLNSPESWPAKPSFGWRLTEAPDSLLQSGSFRLGSVTTILSHPMDEPDVIYRLLELLKNDHASFVGMYKTARLPNHRKPPNLTPGPKYHEPPWKVTDDMVNWITGIIHEAPFTPGVTEEHIRAMLTGKAARSEDLDEIILLMAAVYDHIQGRNPLVIIQSAQLFKCRPELQKAFAKRLKNHILIFVLPWTEQTRESAITDTVIVGSRQRFEFAASFSSMDETAWNAARRTYNRDVGADALGAALDIADEDADGFDELDSIGGEQSTSGFPSLLRKRTPSFSYNAGLQRGHGTWRRRDGDAAVGPGEADKSEMLRGDIAAATRLLQHPSSNLAEAEVARLAADALLRGYHRLPKDELVRVFNSRFLAQLRQACESAATGFDGIELLRPMFSPWIARYHAVLDVIQANGYRIAPFDEYLDHGLRDRTMYIYQDVHAWDIVPALGLALANKDRGISTTFYLSIGQTPLDVEMEDGYRIFERLAGDHVRAGLHTSPFSSWLRMSVFEGDERSFESWLKSSQAPADLRALLSGQGAGRLVGFTRESARAATMEALAGHFATLKSIIPSARSASHLGDPVTGLVRKFGDAVIQANRFVDPILAVDEPEARAAGIEYSPGKIERDNNADGTNNYRAETRPRGAIYCEGGNQPDYLEKLDSWLASGAPSQLLNLPGSLSSGLLTFNMRFAETRKAQARAEA